MRGKADLRDYMCIHRALEIKLCKRACCVALHKRYQDYIHIGSVSRVIPRLWAFRPRKAFPRFYCNTSSAGSWTYTSGEQRGVAVVSLRERLPRRRKAASSRARGCLLNCTTTFSYADVEVGLVDTEHLRSATLTWDGVQEPVRRFR